MLTTYGKQTSLDDRENSNHLRKCLESAKAVLVIFSMLTNAFGYGHIVLSQAYTVYTAASIFLLQVQATRDTAGQAMESLKLCIDGLERIKVTSPGKMSTEEQRRSHPIILTVTLQYSTQHFRKFTKLY